MGEVLFILAGICGCGWMFFRVAGYIEGRPVLSMKARQALTIPAGLGIWLLNLLLMRGCAGFSGHLLGEAAGSMALAALAAALACALGEMSIRRRIRTKPQARQYQGFFH